MSLKRQTLWSIVPLLSMTLVNLVSVPLFYRFLGPEMYAIWFYVASLTGAFGFMDLGLGVAAGRYIGVALGRGDAEAVREYWGTANLIALPILVAMTLVFIVLGLSLGPRWFNVEEAHVDLLRNCFLAGGAGLFLAYYSQFWIILSLAHLDFRYIAIIRTATALMTVISSVGLAWITASPLALIVWGCVLGCIQLMALILHSRRNYKLGVEVARARRDRFREMASYTGKTFVSLIVNSVAASADRLLLANLAPAAAFSHYTIAANAGARIQGMSTAAMGPVFCQTNQSLENKASASVAQIYDEVFQFTFPWYLLAAVWIGIWHEIILRTWLGVELGQAVSPLLAPVVLACCINGIANMSGAQLGSLNRVGTYLAFNSFAGISMICFVYVGWQLGGLSGVAWGFLFSRGVLVAQDLYLARLVGARGWLHYETWKHVIAHVSLGVLFYPLMLLTLQEYYIAIVFAGLHLVLMTAWNLRERIQRLFARPIEVTK